MDYMYFNGQSLWRWILAKREAEQKQKEETNEKA